MRKLRIVEWILAVYFVYTLLLSVTLAVAPIQRVQTAAASLCMLVAVSFASRVRVVWGPVSARDLIPLVGVAVAYRQMGWFAVPKPNFDLEESWMRWDRLLLEEWGIGGAIESLGPVLPEFLELLYLLTYALGPAGLLVLFAYGRADRSDRYLAVFVASAFASYALYPYFPSEPPRVVFPSELVGNHGGAIRALNYWILERGGIHTSVFPSGHVSTSFGVGLGLLLALPERRRFGVLATGLATAIGLATVYGRYHYAVDAGAGLLASLVAYVVCLAAFRCTDESSSTGWVGFRPRNRPRSARR